jgi:hypothetical protein
MKRLALFAAVALPLFGLAGPVAGGPPVLIINEQGILYTSAGAPATGNHTFTFALNTTSSAGTGNTVVWTSAYTVNVDATGYYALDLGDTTAFPSSTALTSSLFTQDLWMSVQVDTDPVMTPFEHLGTAPYAAHALVANSLVAPPNWITSESPVVEKGSAAGMDLVYQSASVTLTPGTWLVQGSATLFSIGPSDGVELSLWDDTNSVEVRFSRSPLGVSLGSGTSMACDGVTTFCVPVPMETSAVMVVTATTTVKLKAYRNGGSTIQVGDSGATSAGTLALPVKQRILALQLY